MASTFADILSTLPSTQSRAACGLFVSGSEKVVPLRLRVIEATVHCDTSFADTTERLAFISDEDVSVVFKFPLPPRSAVYALEATIGDRVIVTEVKEKAQAQAEFNTAVQQGHTAVMAKQEESSQVFTLELGNLEAMQEAVVTVRYLRLLDSVGGALEWVHTATWTPPYLGAAGDAARGPAAAAEQNPRFAGKVSYTLDYTLTLMSNRGIRAVESTAPITCTDLTAEAGAVTSKKVTLSEAVSDPSKDFTVLIDLAPLTAGQHTSSCQDGFGTVSIQRKVPSDKDTQAKEQTVALATFVPRLLPTSDSPTGSETTSLHTELIMVVDCSGSMGGSREQQAREAALYFIKDLPPNRGITFNVVCFGSNWVSWKPSPQEFTAATMTSAVDWVQSHVNSDMGGTEILRALEEAVYKTPPASGYTRSIIFLTDGGISGGEEEAVMQLVSSGSQRGVGPALKSGIQQLKSKLLRGSETTADTATATTSVPAVLCLGIGHGVHRGLLDGMAKRSGGVAQYVVDGESIVRKVGFLKKAALCGASAIHNPRIVCGGALVKLAPHVLPPRLFPDEPLHVLAELTQYEQDNASIELKGKRGNGSDFSVKLPLKGLPKIEGSAYSVLHSLCTVNAMLDGTSPLHCEPDGTPLSRQPSTEAVKSAVVAAAVQANLVTRYTAAVGVMLQRDPLDPKQVKKVEVPLAVPHGADLFKDNNEMEENLLAARTTCMMAMQPQLAAIAPMYRRTAAAPRMVGLLESAKSLFGGRAAPTAARSSGVLCGASYCAPAAAPQYGGARMASPGGAAPGCAPAPPPADLYSLGSAGTTSTFGAPAGGSVAAVDDATTCAYYMEQESGACAADALSDQQDVGMAKMKKKKKIAAKEQMKDKNMSEDEDGEAADAAGVAKPSRSPSDVMSQLNLLRNVEGWWSDSDELLLDLMSQVPGDRATAVAAARAAQPQHVTAQQWVTVLALAFLRKHCAADRGVWEGMDAKAMAWLEANWNAEARSLGFTILAAAKLV